MAKLRLSLACWNYDRTRALFEGRVPVDGIELTCLDLAPEESFFRMLRHREFDISEMSLSSYVLSLFQEEPPFVAIPVFPSRCFRHSGIFVNAESGVGVPQDLAGKRVGTPEFQMTAGVWIRGILSDEYGVNPASVEYFCGGEEQPGREEKLKLSLPSEFRVRPIPPGRTLSAMLASGEIDALYTARIPSTYASARGTVRRLFENFVQVEQDYFRRTGIFPIMHTVVIRREIYEANPWVAQSLYQAFARAQQAAYQDFEESAALKIMLPWVLGHVEQTRNLMGRDFWPYGLEPSLPTLRTFLRYSFEQGLAKRQLSPEELFAPEALDSYKI